MFNLYIKYSIINIKMLKGFYVNFYVIYLNKKK